VIRFSTKDGFRSLIGHVLHPDQKPGLESTNARPIKATRFVLRGVAKRRIDTDGADQSRSAEPEGAIATLLGKTNASGSRSIASARPTRTYSVPRLLLGAGHRAQSRLPSAPPQCRSQTGNSRCAPSASSALPRHTLGRTGRLHLARAWTVGEKSSSGHLEF
jgi:hypothetical protein